MYIYIYVYVYIYMFMNIDIYIDISLFIFIFIFICIFVFVFIFLFYIHMYVYIYMCFYLFISLSIFVPIYLIIHVVWMQYTTPLSSLRRESGPQAPLQSILPGSARQRRSGALRGAGFFRQKNRNPETLRPEGCCGLAGLGV